MDEQKLSDANTSQSPADDLEKLKKQCDEYLAGWKRAQADYQNLKKETEREKIEFVKFAGERLLLAFLPALDQLDLAMANVPEVEALTETQRKSWQGWLGGLDAVKAHWDRLAQTVGLERIPTDGSFDPNLHEAAGEEEGDSPGGIKRVLQTGWKLHGKVLRPARVILTKVIDH